MKTITKFIILLFAASMFSLTACSKDDNEPNPDDTSIVDDGSSSGNDNTDDDGPLLPGKVTKSNSMKLYMHYMPWFQSKSMDGTWGMHWKMNTRNPDNVDASGKRQIASHYYPLIGPYSSKDIDVLEYHFLLMKLAGVDGVLIDWYGESNKNDYPLMRKNTEIIVEALTRVGLEFGIVYEDRTLQAFSGLNAQIEQGKADMTYLQEKFFNKDNYIKIDGKPLLLNFGPEEIKQPASWTAILSVLNPKPMFMPIYGSAPYCSDNNNKNVSGEFLWTNPGNSGFYNTLSGKYTHYLGAAYPGFKDYYSLGGWGSSYTPVDHQNGNYLKSQLEMAKTKNPKYLQLITWNDFGEGTMIEPTNEFGYKFLTEIQKFAEVEYQSTVFPYIYDYYLLKKEYKGDEEKEAQLQKAFNYFNALKIDKAQQIIDELK